MSFTGKYQMVRKENFDEYMQLHGLNNDLVKKGIDDMWVTEINQNDDFTLTKQFKNRSWTNTFTVGEHCELTSVNGVKFMTTPTIEEGKLKIQYPLYLYTAEVNGDELIETNTIFTKKGSSICYYYSKRI
ncbi:gastrotropin-like [Osmerus eperlanus]|uniref:gastrotropin-like n=1 Tax=Osmerus eperlanus TaxID=29151 RepID=UPI002E0EF70E